MRKLSIAVALASTALATPAIARDNAAYVGIEGGVLLVEEFNLDYADPFLVANNAYTIDHKFGIDADVVGGYDFGAFRVESELGYKRAGIDEVYVGTGYGAPVTGPFDAGGSARAISVMLNGLLDFGEDAGLAGYVGGGLGLANVRYNVNSTALDFSQSDRALAWQAIAGVRMPVSANLDVGLKYRFFNTRKLDFGGRDFDLEGRWRSHSLLASLIYNFAPPPPPPVIVPAAPPPPPPPPATQTCPDGSVILATDVCPAPPPPPPPPPPAPERG